MLTISTSAVAPILEAGKEVLRLGGMVAGEIVVPKPLPALVANERLGRVARLQRGDLGLGLVLGLFVVLCRLCSLDLLQ